jgi:hypothetical protein
VSAGITQPLSLIPAHAPDLNPLASFGPTCGYHVPLVFAGCYVPLLGVGPSRHYLRNPCIGAWSLTPRRSSGAFTRFFPEDSGLAPEGTSSARTKDRRNATSTTGCFRGCRHSFTFKLPYSLDLPVAPTAVNSRSLGSQAVYTTHRSVGYLPRDVVSLRVRHEQLTRQDFHLLDCGLAGRSAPLSSRTVEFLESGWRPVIKCSFIV